MLNRIQLPSVFRLLASELRWQLVATLTRSDRRVQELVDIVGQPANLVSYHLRRLRLERVVNERRSSADARDVYYSLDLERLRALYFAAGEALHPELMAVETRDRADRSAGNPTRVLFLCTHNSARSQMGEAIMRQLGGSHVEVFSAGSEPSSVHPDAIAVLAERGIDISAARSKHLNQYSEEYFDYIITVCDSVRESCPAFPQGPERIHWSFPDPALNEDPETRKREFEQVAVQLQTRIRHLITLIEREKRQNV